MVRTLPLHSAGDRSPPFSEGMQPHLLAWIRQRNTLPLAGGKEELAELAAYLPLLARLRLDRYPYLGSRGPKAGDPQDGGRYCVRMVEVAPNLGRTSRKAGRRRLIEPDVVVNHQTALARGGRPGQGQGALHLGSRSERPEDGHDYHDDEQHHQRQRYAHFGIVGEPIAAGAHDQHVGRVADRGQESRRGRNGNGHHTRAEAEKHAALSCCLPSHENSPLSRAVSCMTQRERRGSLPLCHQDRAPTAGLTCWAATPLPLDPGGGRVL